MTGAEVSDELRSFALSLPGAYEDHPWGGVVAKVGKKVFVFLGLPEPDRIYLGVKLRDSLEEAMTYPFVEPMGYGLGKHGWLSVHPEPGDETVPADRLRAWIEESYRLVAPKRLRAELDTADAKVTPG